MADSEEASGKRIFIYKYLVQSPFVIGGSEDGYGVDHTLQCWTSLCLHL